MVRKYLLEKTQEKVMIRSWKWKFKEGYYERTKKF